MKKIFLLLAVFLPAILAAQKRGFKRDDQWDKSQNFSESCQQCNICEEVKDQTNGLVRLKLMKNYITETMKIMNQLVVSMDAELVETGKKLSKFIGPNCINVHTLLDEVMEHSLDDLTAARGAGLSSAMSLGVEQYSENSGEKHHNDRQDLQTGGSSYSKTYAAPSKTSGHPSTYVAPSHPGHSSSNSHQGGHGISSQYSGQHTGFDNNGENSERRVDYDDGLHHGQQFNKNQNIAKNLKPSQNQQNARKPKISKEWTKSEKGRITSSSSSTSMKYSTSSSSGQLIKPNIVQDKKQNCRGVPRGSPHWIPGLDTWCVQNCSAGYCPKTHCICS